MKNTLKIFFLIAPILTISCTSSIAEKVDTESLTKSKYENSNIELNKSYKKINEYSSSTLKKNIKNSQVDWLQYRAKACNTPNLDHPNNVKSTECFTAENSKRIVQLENNYKILKDIINTSFRSLDFDDNKNYSLDFQIYCLCDVSIPYIDTKKNKLLASTSCENNESGQIIEDEIISLTFDEIGRLEVTAINPYGSKYKTAFEHKVDDIYIIVIEGKWGSIKDLNLPEFVAPKNQSNIVTEDICGDFNG
ncbi:lysozyme inhibitor LprI family protein [Psychrobacter sp. DAB_AL43B]|uniref:lysozyme inhibitor LprI family protein n=1 Tax=Psychrobacter sp. DAB_AL43B TaxID=1028416 RepID=UPI0009A7FE95|nr:lysozyme inhibitor LprI family protein [Psychrobacter sp. DAB_AL43B]SLJ84276.1 hypothetical protein DABAL43B_1078 [Psychrobacter sp. DAB_AL43B]